MRDRTELGLQLACLLLAGIVVYQTARIAGRWNPLGNARVPEVPKLAAAGKTNAPNAAAVPKPAQAGTNKPPTGAASATNSVATNSGGTNRTPGNAASSQIASTNKPPPTDSVSSTHALAATNAIVATNLAATTSPPTSAVARATAPASGGPPGSPSAMPGQTPSRPPPGMPPGMPMGMPLGMPPGMGGRMAGPKVPLAPAVQQQVDRIVQSEILAQVMRPMPMGLLGIAGEHAFIRAANGQTGMIKEGAELGGLKLLRIGTNRVLVEVDGKQSELTIFSGYGGESLLQKPASSNP